MIEGNEGESSVIPKKENQSIIVGGTENKSSAGLLFRLKAVLLRKASLAVIFLVVIGLAGVYVYQKNADRNKTNQNASAPEPDIVRDSLRGEIVTEGRDSKDVLNDLMFRAENYIKVQNPVKARESAEQAEQFLSQAGKDEYLRLSVIFTQLGDKDKPVKYLKLASKEILKIRDISVQLQAYSMFNKFGMKDEATQHLTSARAIDANAVKKYETDMNAEVDDGPT